MLMAISAAANGVTGPEIASGLVAASSGDGKECIGVELYRHLLAAGEDVDYEGASGEIESENQAGDPTASYIRYMDNTAGDDRRPSP